MSSSSDYTENEGVVLRQPQRGDGGRFVATLPQSTSADRRRMQQRTYLIRKKRLKDRLLEEFLACIVVRGTSRDSISALRSGNPLARIYEGVVKPCSRHGSNIRCSALKRFYLEGEFMTPSQSSSTRSAPSLPKRLKVYVGCRLPRVLNKREMSKLKKRISSVWTEKVLIQETVEEAFEFCKSAFVDESARGTVENGPQSERTQIRGRTNLGSPSSPPSRMISAGENADDHLETDNSLSRNPTLPSDSIEASIVGRSQAVGGAREEASILLSGSIQTQNAADHRKSERAKALFRIAEDDAYYIMVHLALAEGMEWEFGIFSQMLLDEWKSKGLQTLQAGAELFNNILIFAHEKRYGPSNLEEHEKRKLGIKATAELLDQIRQIISTDEKKYPLFKDMNWSFELT